jgi:hypothetical protein
VFKIGRERLPDGTILMAGILTSGATLPYVWFLIPAFVRSRVAYVLTAESFAVAVETAILWFVLKTSPALSLMLSVGSNAASFVVGQFLRVLHGGTWAAFFRG